MKLSEARFKVYAHSKNASTESRNPPEWHDVDAPDARSAADAVANKAKFVTIHHIHNVDTPEGQKSYNNMMNRVHDFDANTTPASTLFSRAKTALRKD